MLFQVVDSPATLELEHKNSPSMAGGPSESDVKTHKLSPTCRSSARNCASACCRVAVQGMMWPSKLS